MIVVVFLCFVFAFSVSDSFDKALLVHRNCCVCFVKIISKVRLLITTVWISLKKGECFDFNHSLGSSFMLGVHSFTLVYTSKLDF